MDENNKNLENEDLKEKNREKTEEKEKNDSTNFNDNIEKEENAPTSNKPNKEEKPKYVPYTPIISKKKEKQVLQKNDIEKEFYQLKKKRKTRLIIILSLIVLILIAGIFSTGFALLNLNSNKILSGISVRGIDVGGLTKEEAVNVINEKLQYEKTKEVKLIADGEVTAVTLEQIEIEYMLDEALQEAYQIGKDGNIFKNNFTILKSMKSKKDIELKIKYNEELLNDIIEGIDAKLPNAMIDNTYNIEEEELIITRGTPGIGINKDKAKKTIIEMAKSGDLKDINLETIQKDCPEIDVDKIYAEVHTEPQDAYYTTNPFQIYPHKDGINFNVDEVKEMIKEEKEEYTVKLEITKPKVLTNQIGTEAFPNLLGEYSTKYDASNISRSTNLGLAASKINGTVIMPGEVFSYNKTVGKRTVEAGYKEAAGFSGGRVVPMLGGGICQVSSTLYDAVVYANLDIVERHNHMFQLSYIATGKDATVVYGSLDFKFQNNRKYPVMIKASAKSGLLKVQIYGIKEEVEYDIEIVTKILNYTPYRVIYETDSSLAPGQERVSQPGIQGCKSITYKIKKLNGAEVETKVLSSDTYDPQNKVIRRGATQTTSTTPSTPEPPAEQPTTPTEPPAEPTTPSTPEVPETPTTPTEPTTPETPSSTPETPQEPAA